MYDPAEGPTQAGLRAGLGGSEKLRLDDSIEPIGLCGSGDGQVHGTTGSNLRGLAIGP